MISKISSAKNRLLRELRPTASDPAINRSLLLQGSIAARQVHGLTKVRTLGDVEFSVFSQWGEDGIIEWIVNNLPDVPKSFIEFGVEDYVESSTRFLLQNRNWRGLIIDGSDKNIEFVRNDAVSWRHSLTSISQFITTDNIDNIFSEAGFVDEIGILSVDIDGNDYWVWDAISSVNPQVVIAEYNSAFGDVYPVTVPYDPSFVRTNAHHSNLYYGASVSALSALAARKGYTLIGSNSAGSNAFYVRNDLYAKFDALIEDKRPLPSKFREARDSASRLMFVSGIERSKLIEDLPVTRVDTGETIPLKSLGNLYSPDWKSALA